CRQEALPRTDGGGAAHYRRHRPRAAALHRTRPAATAEVWIRKRIFPGAYAPTLGEVLPHLGPNGLRVLDVENLRQHYAQTLRHWLARFEVSYATVEQRFGAEFARGWRLYLAGSVAGFAVGTLQLFQIVFAAP